MRSVASVVFVWITLFETFYARVPELCRTENGIKGMCVPLKFCPKSAKLEQSSNNCAKNGNEQVCCATSSMSAKIMTAEDTGTTPPPVNPGTPPPTVPQVPNGDNPIVFPTEPDPVTIPPITPVSPDNKDNDNNLPLYQKKCNEYHAQSTPKSDGIKVFVVGGTKSDSKEFPHMAALGFGNEDNKQWLCGGSLISENYVVTAAHCISSNAIGEVKYVKLGTNNLQESGEEFNVIRRISHPQYTSPSQYNDIALLELDRPAKLSDYISPICLQDGTDLTSEKMTATGWGKTDFNGYSTPDLQKVDLEYFSNAACQETYETVPKDQLSKGIDDATQVCAGSKTEQKDTCQGDSGGPLQINKNGRLYLVGLTSFGIGCGKVNSPGVYTRVSYYIPWIEDNVWK